MSYQVFDAHADTIGEIYKKNENLKKNTCHVDFERMKEFTRYTQVFAAFADSRAISISHKAYIDTLIDKYKEEIEKCKIIHTDKAEDIDTAKYSSILALEGGECLEGSIENLEYFYKRGARALTLTWNYKNDICDGIDEETGEGLTDFGRKVVKKMNELGMVVDVSHISEKGFYDVVEICEKPFIASHSCVKSICGHRRNLSDMQIRKIIEANGVIGVNFYPCFLDERGVCSIEKIIEHIEYILNLGGENNVGIGSDFDGIPNLPDGMTGIESVKRVADIMEQREYGENLINKILRGNFMRVIKMNLL